MRAARSSMLTLPLDVAGRTARHSRATALASAPAIAPPAGYYYAELVKHPVEVTISRASAFNSTNHKP